MTVDLIAYYVLCFVVGCAIGVAIRMASSFIMRTLLRPLMPARMQAQFDAMEENGRWLRREVAGWIREKVGRDAR